jgi:hypothetical protein
MNSSRELILLLLLVPAGACEERPAQTCIPEDDAEVSAADPVGEWASIEEAIRTTFSWTGTFVWSGGGAAASEFGVRDIASEGVIEQDDDCRSIARFDVGLDVSTDDGVLDETLSGKVTIVGDAQLPVLFQSSNIPPGEIAALQIEPTSAHDFIRVEASGWTSGLEGSLVWVEVIDLEASDLRIHKLGEWE